MAQIAWHCTDSTGHIATITQEQIEQNIAKPFIWRECDSCRKLQWLFCWPTNSKLSCIFVFTPNVLHGSTTQSISGYTTLTVIGFSSYRSPKMGSIPTLSRRSSRRPDQTLVVIQNESSFEKTRWILKRFSSSHPRHFTTRRSVSVIADARSLAMRGEQRKRKRKGGKDEL